MKKLYIDTPAGQIHAVQSGEIGPWLILHHESPLSWRVYEPAVELLARHFRVLLPDTPGYGGSDAGAREWEIPDYAGVLLSAVRSVIGIEPFTVLGCHTGASIALEVATQSDGQASGVVLLGLPVYDEQTRADRLANWAPDIEVKSDGSHLMTMWNRYTRIWEEPPLEAKNAAVMDVLGALAHYNWGYNAAFRYDPIPALERLEVPVLFVTAEFDALADADRRSAQRVGAKLVELAGLPGQIAVRDPERLTQELVLFVGPDQR